VLSELTWLLKTLGFKKIDILGAKLEGYSRNDKLTTEDFEMLVVAEKQGCFKREIWISLRDNF
jgi:3-mercaptopyruvate sulfurtransferase SseA